MFGLVVYQTRMSAVEPMGRSSSNTGSSLGVFCSVAKRRRCVTTPSMLRAIRIRRRKGSLWNRDEISILFEARNSSTSQTSWASRYSSVPWKLPFRAENALRAATKMSR